MRGKLALTELLAPVRRNIPAYAGKTQVQHAKDRSKPEHPRVCGENGSLNPPEAETLGTSPRMRGKLGIHRQPTQPGRNIPAYAGKTGDTIFRSWLQTEHPRVCGENASDDATAPVTAGTSPRMRGKPAFLPNGHSIARNIPAYAGKTVSATCSTLSCQEHPRVCGENKVSVARKMFGLGTSPRMRGKQIRLAHIIHGPGNIPAYAGKTTQVREYGKSYQEHPRVCGENVPISLVRFGLNGTSPRMRGKLGQH